MSRPFIAIPSLTMGHRLPRDMFLGLDTLKCNSDGLKDGKIYADEVVDESPGILLDAGSKWT